MLRGLMMERPLLISDIITHAAELHPHMEIVSVAVEGGVHRYGYADAARRAAKLANALSRAGVNPGDRIATLAWNGYRHFELYYGISGLGAVCHTINPRLFPEQIAFIMHHAADRMLFVDLTFMPLVEALAPRLGGLTVVVMTDRAHMPKDSKLAGLQCYEDLIGNEPDTFVWPELDENTAAGLCYTSGTTGEPKGSLYTHRSSVLHAMFCTLGCRASFQPGSRILPVVPLFHVNAWGLPYSAPLTGSALVFPGPRLDGASLFDLMESEAVNSSWGVPTVWVGLLAEMAKRGRKPKALSEVIIGGAAAPASMIDSFEKDFGVSVVQGWGMTEMSPVGTATQFSRHHDCLSAEEKRVLKRKAGRRLFGVELKIVDDDGNRVPHDGKRTGHLHVRGNSVVSGYFGNAAATQEAFDAEGWFKTGDIASIDADGFMAIVDRSKDLIKSGGEWISSIDIENLALSCPGIAACAVIGLPHPKWDERPLLVAVKAPGADPSKEEILAFIAARVAKWQVPDDVVFTDKLPMTATGKVSKKDLRETYRNHRLPGA